VASEKPGDFDMPCWVGRTGVEDEKPGEKTITMASCRQRKAILTGHAGLVGQAPASEKWRGRLGVVAMEVVGTVELRLIKKVTPMQRGARFSTEALDLCKHAQTWSSDGLRRSDAGEQGDNGGDHEGD
ncbi:unnamed protein product, partial [Cladocopium goreaui]